MARRSRLLPIAFVLAATGAAGGLAAPAFAQMSGAAPTPPEINGGTATGQTYSDATMTKAGHALRDVIGINQSYRSKLAATSDPSSRSAIVAEAKQQASAAVTRDGLTVDQYNQILTTARQDPALRARLLNAAGISANTQ